jgi:hypothetical protein
MEVSMLTLKVVVKSILIIHSACMVANAQVFDWEDPVQILTNEGIYSVYSDGYGQHVLTFSGTELKHYLFGNDGNVLFTRLWTQVPWGGAVTGFGGVLSVVMDRPPGSKITG